MKCELLAICECSIDAEDESSACRVLIRGIEDVVTDVGELKRISVNVVGAGRWTTSIQGSEKR